MELDGWITLIYGMGRKSRWISRILTNRIADYWANVCLLILILVFPAPWHSHQNSAQVQWFNQTSQALRRKVIDIPKAGRGYKQISKDLRLDRVLRRNLGLHKTFRSFRSCTVLLFHASAHGVAFQWVWGQDSDPIFVKYLIFSV